MMSTGIELLVPGGGGGGDDGGSDIDTLASSPGNFYEVSLRCCGQTWIGGADETLLRAGWGPRSWRLAPSGLLRPCLERRGQLGRTGQGRAGRTRWSERLGEGRASQGRGTLPSRRARRTHAFPQSVASSVRARWLPRIPIGEAMNDDGFFQVPTAVNSHPPPLPSRLRPGRCSGLTLA